MAGNTGPEQDGGAPVEGAVEQAATRRRPDILRELAWFELSRCMDDSGPRHMSTELAAEVIFGTPAEQPGKGTDS